MSNPNIPSEPERNLETYEVHRREVFWQITLPIAIGAGLILTIAILVLWAAVSDVGNVSKLADASLILLIAPLLILTLLFIAMFIGVAYAVTKILGVTPFYARRAQDTFTMIKIQVRKGSDAVVEPFMRVRSFWASVTTLFGKK